MKAYLILEDGNVFEGESVGADKEVVSEFVFNTSMTGYVEVLTDPSYAGQSVVMTYPLIGNYGVCLEDQESTKPYVEGFVVNELARLGSNFRKNVDLKDYLIEHDIPCIQGIDTRHLTKIIRNKGCMNGMITTTKYDDLSEVMEKIHNFKVTGVVEKTTCDKPYKVGTGDRKVALLDFGAKKNIAKSLANRNIEVTVYPASTPASTIIEGNYDGVMLSNGPGDPEDLTEVIENIKKLVGVKPIVGICLGHQLLALTLGGHTTKLKFGHRGCNHPVKDLERNMVHITSQNHGYVVNELPEDVVATHININDGTIEGMKHTKLPIYSVQFHPEAAAGPEDSEYIFDRFMEYAL